MEFFFNTSNPIFFIILSMLLGVATVYIVVVYYVIPQQKKHFDEKKELELKNEKMISLFTTENPNPVFRFDHTGTILMTNDSGYAMFPGIDPVSQNLTSLIPELHTINLSDIITRLEDYSTDASINTRDYQIRVKGVPDVNFGHAYCFDITDRKRDEEKLKRTQSKLRELTTHIQDVVEINRNALAMELHDGICQTVSTIKLVAERLDEHLVNSEESEQIYTEMINIIDSAVKEIRELSYSLTPKLLGEFGLISAIQTLLDQVRTNSDLHISFQHYGNEDRISQKLEISIYRVLQEIINNILKHAHATAFSVQLFKDSNKISLLVEDNGRGFDVENAISKGGLGLLNMRERIENLNGSINFSSGKSAGTEVMIDIPLQQSYASK